MSFKPGDKVVCIHDGGALYTNKPTVGYEYTVDYIGAHFPAIHFLLSGPDHSILCFRHEHFILSSAYANGPWPSPFNPHATVPMPKLELNLHRACAPLHYEGFTETYFYCHYCDHKSKDLNIFLGRTCIKP